MTTPGFSAESSLYRTNNHYRSVAGESWSGKTSGQVGLAQVRPTQCTPFCVQACTPDSESQTGFSRFCINSECEPVRQPCSQLPRAPGEADCWYGHWCGPLCGRGDPIDNLDECCRAHDWCYDARGWGACSCDLELVACAFPKQFEIWHPGKAAAAVGAVALFSAKISHGLCEEIGGGDGGGGGGGGGGSPQPVQCPSGTRCCEPVNGLCASRAFCVPPGAQCP